VLRRMHVLRRMQVLSAGLTPAHQIFEHWSKMAGVLRFMMFYKKQFLQRKTVETVEKIIFCVLLAHPKADRLVGDSNPCLEIQSLLC
jgi:hypothetical protein